MDIYENTTIFIACPAGKVSGGPELLHQLCSELLRRGLRAFMWYPDAEKDKIPQPQVYEKYLVPIAPTLLDVPEHILIIPETLTLLYGRCHHIRKILWWMSVDNYLTTFSQVLTHYSEVYSDLALVSNAFCFYPDTQMEHWVQSEYARQFVHANHVADAQVHFVGDYLQSAAHLSSMGKAPSHRQDIVAYNPKKGFSFTQQLMAAAPDIAWTPIENMTAAEVHALLSRAKCYIDFGSHPGQDRIPREAAAAGCCVITGRRGAAANDIDIPTPDAYKFADTPESIPAILACLRACLADYDGHAQDFDSYRTMIAGQKERFRRDVAAALPIRYDAPQRQHVILQNGPHIEKLPPALLSSSDIRLVAIWLEDAAITAVQAGSTSIPAITLAELAFLYQEGRIDAILLDSNEQEKDARRLTAAGIPEAIFC